MDIAKLIFQIVLVVAIIGIAFVVLIPLFSQSAQGFSYIAEAFSFVISFIVLILQKLIDNNVYTRIILSVSIFLLVFSALVQWLALSIKGFFPRSERAIQNVGSTYNKIKDRRYKQEAYLLDKSIAENHLNRAEYGDKDKHYATSIASANLERLNLKGSRYGLQMSTKQMLRNSLRNSRAALRIFKKRKSSEIRKARMGQRLVLRTSKKGKR